MAALRGNLNTSIASILGLDNKLDSLSGASRHVL